MGSKRVAGCLIAVCLLVLVAIPAGAAPAERGSSEVRWSIGDLWERIVAWVGREAAGPPSPRPGPMPGQLPPGTPGNSPNGGPGEGDSEGGSGSDPDG